MVSHYNLAEGQDKCEYLRVIKGSYHKTLTFSNQAPKKDELLKVFEWSGAAIFESFFVSRIMQILSIILENSDEIDRKNLASCFDDFPLPGLFIKSSEQFHFDNIDIALLQKYFSTEE